MSSSKHSKNASILSLRVPLKTDNTDNVIITVTFNYVIYFIVPKYLFLKYVYW